MHDVDLAVCLCPGGNAAFLASHRADNDTGRSGQRLNAAGADAGMELSATKGRTASKSIFLKSVFSIPFRGPSVQIVRPDQ